MGSETGTEGFRVFSCNRIVVSFAEWAATGPLLAQCGFKPQEIIAQPDRWVELGQYLGSSLGCDAWKHLSDFEKWAAVRGL